MAARSYREGGSGSMVALTAHAHSLYGRETYTPLAPGSATADRSRAVDLGERPSLNNLFSPAMRYISPMKNVPVVSSPAPFVVRHATSDFISGSAESRLGSPSVSYPLNTVSRSGDGMGSNVMSSSGVIRVSKSAVIPSASRKANTHNN